MRPTRARCLFMHSASPPCHTGNLHHQPLMAFIKSQFQLEFCYTYTPTGGSCGSRRHKRDYCTFPPLMGGAYGDPTRLCCRRTNIWRRLHHTPISRRAVLYGLRLAGTKWVAWGGEVASWCVLFVDVDHGENRVRTRCRSCFLTRTLDSHRLHPPFALHLPSKRNDPRSEVGHLGDRSG